jgi:hypothetical protein
MLPNPIPEKYRSEYLFLLIGENPLPNYVSALLLIDADKKSTIYLLHSDGANNTPSTKPYADLLLRSLRLKLPNAIFRLYELNESDSTKIAANMKTILEREKISGKVGLNYTGGTKPMSHHSYLALRERFPNAVFSYLDASQLALRIDGETTRYPVAQAVEVSLEELAQLHGYELKNIRKTPRQEKLAQALAQVHATDKGFEEWRKWCSRLGEPMPTLPHVKEFPNLKPVVDTFDEICGGANETTPEKIAIALGFDQLKNTAKWFIGEWLEDWTLAAIMTNIQRFNILHYGISLNPKPHIVPPGIKTNFDLDVATMIGYQLFAISCHVSDPGKGERGVIKDHLLEVFVRAQQLGGDEARAALVCTSKNPESLQAELEWTWNAWGRIRVFGRYELPDLANAFRVWFMQSTK